MGSTLTEYSIGDIKMRVGQHKAKKHITERIFYSMRDATRIETLSCKKIGIYTNKITLTLIKKST